MSNNPEDHYAYGRDMVHVETVMRLSAVKRWHMIDTTRTQNLAEHSANVAVLAFVIAARCPLMYFGSGVAIAGKALLHDIPEVFIGDIPTHSKKWLDRESIDTAEKAITPPCFYNTPVDDRSATLIKICDLADAIRFIRIHGADVTSRHAQEGIEKQFWKKFLSVYKAWPLEVLNHVLLDAYFYAYETRVYSPGATVPANVQDMVDDVARGSGNFTWGPGSELCDLDTGARNGLAGVEGGQRDHGIHEV
jgi:hypothetical protein